MEISLQDFNALSAEQSRREVRIAQLEMELRAQQEKYTKDITALSNEREALLTENYKLREQIFMLEADFENVRFENQWMKQFLWLSVKKVHLTSAMRHPVRACAC